MDSDPHSVTRAGNMLRSVVLDVPPADSLSCNSGALSSREQPGTHRREQEVVQDLSNQQTSPVMTLEGLAHSNLFPQVFNKVMHSASQQIQGMHVEHGRCYGDLTPADIYVDSSGDVTIGAGKSFSSRSLFRKQHDILQLRSLGYYGLAPQHGYRFWGPTEKLKSEHMSNEKHGNPHCVARHVLLNKLMTQAASAEEIKLWCAWRLLNEVSDCFVSNQGKHLRNSWDAFAQALQVPDNWPELVGDELLRLGKWSLRGPIKASLSSLVTFVRNSVSHALDNFEDSTGLTPSLRQELGWAGLPPKKEFAQIGVMRFYDNKFPTLMPAAIRFYQNYLVAPMPGFNLAAVTGATGAAPVTADAPDVVASPAAAGHVPPVAAPTEADRQNLSSAVTGPPASVQPSSATANSTEAVGASVETHPSASARWGWAGYLKGVGLKLWIWLITFWTGAEPLTRTGAGASASAAVALGGAPAQGACPSHDPARPPRGPVTRPAHPAGPSTGPGHSAAGRGQSAAGRGHPAGRGHSVGHGRSAGRGAPFGIAARVSQGGRGRGRAGRGPHHAQGSQGPSNHHTSVHAEGTR